MSELLTIDDVARFCQVHKATIRRHIASGRLRSVRVGRAVRVRKQDLDMYLDPEERPVDPDLERLANAKPFTMDDPLWNIVGMFNDPGDAWVSGDKRRALAEAYLPQR